MYRFGIGKTPPANLKTSHIYVAAHGSSGAIRGGERTSAEEGECRRLQRQSRVDAVRMKQGLGKARPNKIPGVAK